MIVLVHGYPDSSEVWIKVAQQLALQFHVVAYDVRGSGESDAPAHIRDYNLTALTHDFNAVIDFVSPDRSVHLVGHDWGSIQCWEFVTDPQTAQRIASYTSLSGPCLDHVGFWLRKRLLHPTSQHLKEAGNQIVHSWYIGLFHLPLVAPLMWRFGLDQAWPSILFRSENIDEPMQKHQRRNGINGINLYRANFLRCLLLPRKRYTKVPVKLVIAEQDDFVTSNILAGIEQWTDHLTRTAITAKHWLPLSKPLWIADQIRDFVETETAKI